MQKLIALQDWRIKYQILFVQVIASMLTITLVMLIAYIYFNTRLAEITTQEKKILLNRQMSSYTNSILVLFQESIDRLFMVNEKYLTINQNLYNYVSNNEITFLQQVDKCLQVVPEVDQAYIGQFCYGIFGKGQQYNEYLQLSNLLTEALPMLDITNLYFASTGSEQFMSYWPGQPFGAFVPHSRPWYINHIQKMNTSTFVFSEPYLNYFGGITVTATANITDIGVSGIDISLDSVTQLTKLFNFLEVMIIDQNGKLILCKYYDEGYPNISYFQNQSLTGFNQEDYNQVQQFQSGNYTATCDSNIKTLCLQDNNGTDWRIITQQISNPSYIIIFKIKTSLFTEELQLMVAEFEKQWDTFKNIQILIGLSITAFVMLILVVTSTVIQKPIDQILHYAKFAMKNNKPKQHFLQSNVNTINELNWAFQSLLNLRVRNNQQHIEDIRYFRQLKYPINELYFGLSELQMRRMIDRELNLNEWAERNCHGHFILRNTYFLKQMTIRLLRGISKA